MYGSKVSTQLETLVILTGGIKELPLLQISTPTPTPTPTPTSYTYPRGGGLRRGEGPLIPLLSFHSRNSVGTMMHLSI